MSLTVGHITYANCVPFFHFLDECGFSGEIVRGVPAELNKLMASGKLDICPSSSIEYALHVSDYLLLPDHSISSVGPVQSVLLFTDIPLSGLNGVPVTITGESATSVALLKVLLLEFFQLSEVICQKAEISDGNLHEQSLPILLIGDRALKARSKVDDSCMMIDLGELWYHYTGLPFVFALWIVNRSVAEKRRDEVKEFSNQLKKSRDKAFSCLDEISGKVEEKEWMGQAGLVEYWRQVSYDFDPLHIEGLRCFYVLLEKHGLIDSVPEITFFT